MWSGCEARTVIGHLNLDAIVVQPGFDADFPGGPFTVFGRIGQRLAGRDLNIRQVVIAGMNGSNELQE